MGVPGAGLEEEALPRQPLCPPNRVQGREDVPARGAGTSLQGKTKRRHRLTKFPNLVQLAPQHPPLGQRQADWESPEVSSLALTGLEALTSKAASKHRSGPNPTRSSFSR